VERRSLSCQGSGTRPSEEAKLTRFRARRRSAARLGIVRAFQCCHDGAQGLQVGLQDLDYHGPQLHPLGGDGEVHILGPYDYQESELRGRQDPVKDFFDKPFPKKTKDFTKEIKIEKAEKPEKGEKREKLEKREIKEVKNE
jgi:hypothetical protein